MQSNYVGDCGDIIMKTLKILTILMVMVLFALPVNAQDESTTIVTPESGQNPTINAIDTVGSIIQGETDWYDYYIPSVPRVTVDLVWHKNPSNSLTLTIYRPDGIQLGPYHDADDGLSNGRIYLRLTESSGNFPAGTWRFKVYGESVQGSEDYDLTVSY